MNRLLIPRAPARLTLRRAKLAAWLQRGQAFPPVLIIADRPRVDRPRLRAQHRSGPATIAGVATEAPLGVTGPLAERAERAILHTPTRGGTTEPIRVSASVAQKIAKEEVVRLRKGCWTAAIVPLCLTAESVESADLGKALSRPITGSFTSSKGIFDLERCIILLDGRGLPFVFRQPDRPAEEVIAFSQGLAINTVITLRGEREITKVETRDMTGLMSGAGHKLPRDFESCL